MSTQRISSNTPRWKYDAFISFSEDTQKNFVNHLYVALKQRGLSVFMNDKETEGEKSISPKLLEAIEKSRFFIVVFSRKYASSTLCLDELFKIVDCTKTNGQTIFPIFYGVDPSVIKKQTENLKEVFSKYEEMEDKEKVQIWRNVLSEVADIAGWHLQGSY